MSKKASLQSARGLPTPLAGLALGIASLGWCLENALPLAGWGQTTGAVIGLVMIGFLVLRFTAHHDTLWADLKHPVVGSIVPTFAMCLMVVSKTAGYWMPEAASQVSGACGVLSSGGARHLRREPLAGT